MKQRLLALDAIKGLAILMVVMGHIYYRGGTSKVIATSFLIDSISAIHISFFIIVSGYFSQKFLDNIFS